MGTQPILVHYPLKTYAMLGDHPIANNTTLGYFLSKNLLSNNNAPRIEWINQHVSLVLLL